MYRLVLVGLAGVSVAAGSAWAQQGSGAAVTTSSAVVGVADAGTAQDQTNPQEIVVTADRRGTFSADYVQAGTFRDSRLLDTPLTVAILTRSLLDAQQVQSLGGAMRNTPGVTEAQINTSIYSNLSIRGIPVNNFTNVRWNGVLPVINLIEQPIESKDRIEVLKGAAGLYYGFAAPSGIINLVTERPTAQPVTRFALRGDANGSIGADIDVGRRIGNVGFRVNAGSSLLRTGVSRTDGERFFTTGAFDWRASDRLEVLLDAEYIYKTISEPAVISLTAVKGAITLPPLPPASRNLGDRWMQARGRETNLLARVRYQLASDWRLALAVGQSYLTRDRAFSSFGGYDPATGNGRLTVAQTSGNDYTSRVYRGDLSGRIRTGPVVHDILVGVAYQTRDGAVPTAVRRSFAQNLYAPVSIAPQPAAPRIIPNPTQTTDLGAYVFDRASLGDWLQATIGYRKTEYIDESRTSRLRITPGTFSYGMLIKPVRWASVYGNYIEGLEPGPVAQQIANNAGEILPAAVSKQKEAGVKVEPLRGLVLTGGWFRISRPSAYLNSANFFVQDGEAVYEGGEFGAVGELTPYLSLSASAMTLDATQRSGAASVVGKRIENVARFSGSVFLEYRLPQLPDLRLSAGMFHVGSRAVDALNQAFVPGYDTFDLGASYGFTLLGKRATMRAYGQNVTGKRYWAATGSDLLAPGLPATVRLSLDIAL